MKSKNRNPRELLGRNSFKNSHTCATPLSFPPRHLFQNEYFFLKCSASKVRQRRYFLIVGLHILKKWLALENNHEQTHHVLVELILRKGCRAWIGFSKCSLKYLENHKKDHPCQNQFRSIKKNFKVHLLGNNFCCCSFFLHKNFSAHCCHPHVFQIDHLTVFNHNVKRVDFISHNVGPFSDPRSKRLFRNHFFLGCNLGCFGHIVFNC